MTKIACTGPDGRVGRLLVEKHGVVPLSCDVTDGDAVERELDAVRPHVLVHLAGISDVDYCERKENWKEVMRVNFTGAVNVAQACQDRKIMMVYLSSEHVFSGKSFFGIGGGPYNERSKVKPINGYGLTKLAAEGLRLTYPVMKIVRSSYCFNWDRLMKEFPVGNGAIYQVPTFLQRSYIYLPHFVKNLYTFACNVSTMPSILHLAGSKTVSQYQFVKDFVKYSHAIWKIEKRQREWPQRPNDAFVAPRPYHGGLDVSLSARLGFPQYSYEDGFKEMEI